MEMMTISWSWVSIVTEMCIRDSPYTPQNEEEYFQQLEQWNDEDEYTRCIQALNAIPEDLSLIHI